MSITSSYYSTGRSDDYLRHAVPVVSLSGEAIPVSEAHKEAYSRWCILRDVHAGSDTVKSKTTKYLRKLAAHRTTEDYLTYLSRATFYNGLFRTHKGLLTSLLKELPSTTVPPQLTQHLPLDHVSANGFSLNQLQTYLASEVLLVNRAGILVDYPRDVLPTDPQQIFLNPYAAESIHYVRRTTFRGQSVVDRIVLVETETVHTEYAETVSPRYRLLRLDYDESINDLVYSQEIHYPGGSSSGTTTKEVIPILIRGRTMNRIPFVFFSTEGDLPEYAKPSLMDLCYLNLSHYESSALLEHGRFYAAMPTYFIRSGSTQSILQEAMAASQDGKMPAGSQMAVGPSNIWMLEQEDVPGILEFTGHGLSFVENAVDSKQLQMQSLGGRMIPTQRRAAALSDEAYELMELGDEAILIDTARNCSAGLTKALRIAEEMMNLVLTEEQKSTVVYSENFQRSDISTRELALIQAFYDRGLLPADDLYRTLRNMGLLAAETPLKEFRKLLEQHGGPVGPLAPGANPAPSKSPPTSRDPNPADPKD